MNIDEAIVYLQTKKMQIIKLDKGYQIINPQNVGIQVNEQAIINYAMELKHPKKVVSLVPNWYEF
jgi:hypothetical protein